jgi:hypothetical protein
MHDQPTKGRHMTTPQPSTERTATPEEWAALLRSVPRRVALHLESGTSFTRDGVRIHPPLGYLAGEPVLVRKTTTRFARKGASN